MTSLFNVLFFSETSVPGLPTMIFIGVFVILIDDFCNKWVVHMVINKIPNDVYDLVRNEIIIPISTQKNIKAIAIYYCMLHLMGQICKISMPMVVGTINTLYSSTMLCESDVSSPVQNLKWKMPATGKGDVIEKDRKSNI